MMTSVIVSLKSILSIRLKLGTIMLLSCVIKVNLVVERNTCRKTCLKERLSQDKLVMGSGYHKVSHTPR